MFFTVFATLGALLGLYAGSNADDYDYNNMIGYKMALADQNVTEVSSFAYDDALGNYREFYFSDLDDMIQDSSNRYFLRYYISSDVTYGNNQGYIDFYLTNDGSPFVYLQPHVEVFFQDTVNLYIDVQWLIYNSDNPSVAHFNRSFHFDMSNFDNTHYTYFEDLKSTFITGITNGQDKNTSRFIISCSPMNEQDWYSSSNSYQAGYDQGFTDGESSGHDKGYAEGYTEANNTNPTATVIFSGIISIGLMPINFFLAILNFEVFGINIGAFVSALLTVAIIVIIIKIIVGSGVNGGDGK